MVGEHGDADRRRSAVHAVRAAVEAPSRIRFFLTAARRRSGDREHVLLITGGVSSMTNLAAPSAPRCRAHAGAQHLRDLHEHPVAGFVAERRVEALKSSMSQMSSASEDCLRLGAGDPAADLQVVVRAAAAAVSDPRTRASMRAPRVRPPRRRSRRAARSSREVRAPPRLRPAQLSARCGRAAGRRDAVTAGDHDRAAPSARGPP